MSDIQTKGREKNGAAPLGKPDPATSDKDVKRVGEQSLDSVARMLARGQARIVTAERGRLVDRAWQATLNALRSFAGRGDKSGDDGTAEATP